MVVRPRPILVGLLLLAFVCPNASLAAPKAPDHEQALSEAQSAFDAGRFREALELVQRVPDDHARARDAHFLQAYTLYKLARLDEAEALLEKLLAQETTPQVGMLMGMVSYGQAKWDQARRHLKAVIEAGVEPWDASARKLLKRVEVEREIAVGQAHDDAIKTAKQLLKARRYAEAEQALDRAEALRPGHYLTRYYRGFLAYQRERYPRAVERFTESSAIAPRDSWSRYMLALSLAEVGRPSRARTLLTALVDSADDAKVRDLSRRALTLLDNPRADARGGPTVILEFGTGLDTNPAYIDELPDLEPSMELHLAALAGYQRWLTSALQGTVGLKAFERTYAVGGERYEQTDIAAWGSLSVVLDRFSLDFGYSYGLFLYGHEPLLSLHSIELSSSFAVTAGLRIIASAMSGWQLVHDDERRHLEAVRGGGHLLARWGKGPFVLEGGYGMARSLSEPVIWTRDLVIAQGPGPNAPTTTIPDAIVTTTDYSLLEHGPLLWGQVELPWRLSFQAGAGLWWRLFDASETESNTHTGASEVYDPRRDLRLTGMAEIARALPAGLEVALRFESVNNLSSFTTSSRGVDFNYTRYLVGGVLRWKPL
jgi:tetratricopeptide (TPR) repeat protein